MAAMYDEHFTTRLHWKLVQINGYQSGTWSGVYNLVDNKWCEKRCFPTAGVTLKSQHNRLSDVHSMRRQRKIGENLPSCEAYLGALGSHWVGPPGTVDSIMLFSMIHINLKTVEYEVVTETFLGKE